MEHSEYNQRQYRRMLAALASFEHGEVRIGDLVTSLDGLLNALEDAESSWKQTFLHEWGILEDARAGALFRGLEHLDTEASERVRLAMSNLKLMVLEQIDDVSAPPK